MQVPIGCPVCHQAETIEHMTWECPWAAKVWELLLGLLDPGDGCVSIHQWLSKRFLGRPESRADKGMRWATVLIACWSIWKARCACAFEGRFPDHRLVVQSIFKLVQECKLLQARSIRPQSTDLLLPIQQNRLLQAWTPPSRGSVKVNCDAAWNGSTGAGGIGVLARDHEGRIAKIGTRGFDRNFGGSGCV